MSKEIRILYITLLVMLAGCNPKSHLVEPEICYYPQTHQFQTYPSPFPKLTKSEYEKDWAKELIIGIGFARELDLYRAITAYKRALMLIPRDLTARRQQIAYGITLCYFLGHKYQEAVETFEKSELSEVTSTFPAIEDLIIILYDSYRRVGQCEKSDKIMDLIEKSDEKTAKKLKISNAIQSADFKTLSQATADSPCKEEIRGFLDKYCQCKKSVRKAQTLNALLPGAGYAYLGQKRTAITSFIINALFGWATYHFFEHKNIPAGIIAGSLEMGWYLGGINGAGLEAKYFNERLYNQLGKETMIDCGLFPVIMLQTSF